MTEITITESGSNYIAYHPAGFEIARALTPIESADRAFDNWMVKHIDTARYIDVAGRQLAKFKRGQSDG